MTGSAIYGHPPNNQRDVLIVQGLFRFYGLPKRLDPARGMPGKIPEPPNYRFETRGPGMIVGFSVAILLSFLITGTRLLLRGVRKDLRWGLDDWVIIPAAVGSSASGGGRRAEEGLTAGVAGYGGVDGIAHRDGHPRGHREAYMGCHL
jgi:hypothetical protein